MPNLTVGDLIRSSMRKIGVLAAGEPLPADEGADALESFRVMVDGWALENLLIPVVGVVTHSLQSGVVDYTIGIYPSPVPDPLPSSHIETARPQQIVSAFIRDASQTDYPQSIIDVKTYSEISRKTSSSRPSRIYIRKGWPLNNLIFDAAPYANETLHLEVIQPLSEILPAASLTEVINLPPGYQKALTYSLCIDLADEWGKDITQSIAVNATEGKKWLKRSNYRKVVLGMDRALTNRGKGRGTYVIEQGP